MQPKYTINGVVHDVTPVRRTDQIILSIDGHQIDVRLQWRDRHRGEISVNGHPHEFYAAQDGNTLFIHVDGKAWQLEAHNEFGDSLGGGESGGKLCAPMPGVVVEILVSVGDSVAAGASVMLIESMKLQTEIKTGIAGIVATVGVEAGSSFEKGAVLVCIEANGVADSGAGTTG